VLEKESFQRAVKIAGSFASYNAGEITLSFNPEEKTCILSSQSQEIGANKTTLPIEVQEGSVPLTIVFNPRYVLEGINALLGEKILFLANDGATPAGLRVSSDKDRAQSENYLYIIMPIRK
jgi:DNA polymerase III sliding clamp (beta) subunit (PCNA family)